MAVNWDLIINITVIVTLILFFWAKLTHQTIGELIRGVREFVMETKEEAVEKSEDLIYYD